MCYIRVKDKLTFPARCNMPTLKKLKSELASKHLLVKSDQHKRMFAFADLPIMIVTIIVSIIGFILLGKGF